jgi:hypothetical protein
MFATPGVGHIPCVILFKQSVRHYVSPEAVAATQFHEMLSGRQRRRDVKVEPSHQQHPEDGDGVGYRNVGEPSRLDAAVCLSESISLQLDISVLLARVMTDLSDGAGLGAFYSGVSLGGTHFEFRPTR